MRTSKLGPPMTSPSLIKGLPCGRLRRNLPFWQAETVGGQYKQTKEPALFADSFVPAVDTVLRVRGRLDQRIGLLRLVEALRLHAAENDGTLPTKLSEISLPLPLDPFTGKPFRYEAAGNTAHLRGTPPPGMEEDASYNVHYEVIIRR